MYGLISEVVLGYMATAARADLIVFELYECNFVAEHYTGG